MSVCVNRSPPRRGAVEAALLVDETSSDETLWRRVEVQKATTEAPMAKRLDLTLNPGGKYRAETPEEAQANQLAITNIHTLATGHLRDVSFAS